MTDPTSVPVPPSYPSTPANPATPAASAFPAYPTTPSYGSQPHPTQRVSTPPSGPAANGSAGEHRSGTWLSVGLAVAFNLVSLLGVTAFGWPAGNVFLLFWAENAVLGVFTLVKVASATAPSTSGSLRINGKAVSPTASPTLYALFFTFHYGLFCVVHLVFTAIVAYKIGYQLSFFFIGVPLILIVIRYTVETLTTWFGPGGQRWTMSPSAAMGQPYPRIIVLHFAVLVGFGLVISQTVEPEWLDTARDMFGGLLELLPAAWQTQGVLLVLVLLVIKTVVDIGTTLRATRSR